jgi:hypothetical protein
VHYNNDQLVHTPDSSAPLLIKNPFSRFRFQKEPSFLANTHTCIPVITTTMRFTAVNLPVIVLAPAVGAAALPRFSGNPMPMDVGPSHYFVLFLCLQHFVA